MGTQLVDTFTLNNTLKGNNAAWRLNAARQLLSRSVKGPVPFLFGAGFGRPSRFWDFGEWWDTRTGGGGAGDPTVVGPHDGVVDVIYRMGWPAAVVFVGLLLAVLAGALRRIRRARPSDARVLRSLVAVSIAGIFTFLTSDGLRGPQFAVPFICVVSLLAARSYLVGRAAEQDRTVLERDSAVRREPALAGSVR
jgi:hypothetical protein